MSGASTQVALKAVHEECRDSLILEFERLTRVSHPGLAQVIGLFQADREVESLARGTLYFASEFIDGQPLADEVQELGGIERVEALLELCAQLSSALSYLHAHELVHGDIKPDNIRKCGRDQRVVLLDLGLARSPGPGLARGSVAYMAPEALAGHLDVRSDLYSLGATLVEYALGERLYPQEGAEEVISAILRADESQIAQRLAAFPDAFVELLLSLLASDPSDRPSGANALLAHVARVREALRLPPKEAMRSANFSRPEFVGRRQELAALGRVLRAHSAGESLGHALQVIGKHGSGRRRLIEESILRQEVECARQRRPPLSVVKGTLEELWPPACPGVQAFVAHCAQRSGDPMLLVLLDDEDPRVADLLRAVIPNHLLLLACRQTPSAIEAPAIVLAGLAQSETADLCQRLSSNDVPEEWSAGVHQLSQALPGRICEFMQTTSILDAHFREKPDSLLVDGTLSASLLRRVASLESNAAALLEELAVADRPMKGSELVQALGVDSTTLALAAQELVVAGLLHSHGDAFRCSSREYARVIEQALPAPRRRALHRRALRTSGAPLPIAAQARHLLVVGPAKEAARVALLAIEERCDAGRHDQAWALCIASAKQMSGKAASLHAALSAEVALTTGEYQLAANFADKARRSRDATIQRRGISALARCAQHQGDVERATSLLSSLVEQAPEDASARANYAKILFAQGALHRALEVAGCALELQAEPADRFLAREVAGLANLYLGKLEDAAGNFDLLPEIAVEAEDLRLMGRAQGLRGMLAQKEGRLQRAAELYSDAARKSAQSGATHAAAVFSLNSATVEQRSGHYAAALDALQVALRDLRRSGTPFELAAAHCNRGNVLLALGETEAAGEEAQVAQNLANSASEPRIHYYAHLLLGDIARRKQMASVASRHYRDACKLADDHQLSDGVLAHLALNEVSSLSGDKSGTALRARLPADTPEQRAKSLESCVRVHLALGEVTATLADEVDELCVRLESADDLDLGWRVAVLAARTRQVIGEDRAYRSAVDRASRIFQVVMQRTPEAYRDGLRSHPDAQALDGLLHDRRSEVRPSAELGQALPLRRLLTLSRRLNSELRIDALLDDIIDTAVELSRAERAFLLLRNGAGQLELRVARNIDREHLDEQTELSRSIAEKVARTGQVILTVDAEQDGRFGASLSVAALQLRSILAVPFRVKSRIVGTLYLDHRFRRGAFDDLAVEVVRELAGIAAVALENARLATDNRRRQAEIDTLNERLESRLENAEAQLASARARIPGERPAMAFSSIVGDSPALREALAVAERAAGCDLPVVISGESGTGKELMARAVHENSSRRDQAFVALNCGAVPDSLLEAELFGYRKGAFTGAERARQGLFRVADGGTLFLDEIADTSLAMQSKLLRALQDGEIRPLGSERTVNVDIRVLCASNKHLETLVEEGQFREDLYYRLNVLSLHVPALRERRSDIAAIAQHILHRLGTGVTLSPGALRALQAFSWPGNVRELENELTRACALADMETIEPLHLSAALQELPTDRAHLASGDDTDQLLLKPQVEALERSVVEEAMRQTGGNQSKAALRLGLSRYGLQKKLQRYGISSARFSKR